MVDLPHRQVEEAEGTDVAICGGFVLQECDRIRVVAGEAAVNRVVVGAGGLAFEALVIPGAAP